MANQYLTPVFRKLYGEQFDYSRFDHRMEMQKSIYLLQDMGVPVGEYGFRWYLHGPYSQSLQDDMYEEKDRPASEIDFYEDYNTRIEKLRDLIHSQERGEYSLGSWMECVASMRYLCKNVLRYDADMDQVLDALQERKPHLSNREINAAAYHRMEELFAV